MELSFSLKKNFLAGAVVVLLFGIDARGAGIKIGSDDVWASLSLLAQARSDFRQGAAPDGISLDSDIYLRRLRLLMWGQLDPRINFFVQTDIPNLGKNGDFAKRMYVQDAWIEIALAKWFQLDAGMLLVPFSHQGMQGAVSLHTMDYHSAVVRYPSGSNLVWRDFGIMARGLLLNDTLEYRLAILNGVRGSDTDPRNPHDLPRVTGRLTVNLAESEAGPGVAGFFYDGAYLAYENGRVVSTKRVLSFGASVDWQPDLNVELAPDGTVSGSSDYFAVAVDAFADLPLNSEGTMAVVAQADFYYYDHGKQLPHAQGTPSSYYTELNPDSSLTSGYGLASEAGIRFSSIEVLFLSDWFHAIDTEESRGDFLGIFGAINWWLRGHASSIKVQAGADRIGAGDWNFFGAIQLQLFL